MSERMIELQRARLLAANGSASSSSATKQQSPARAEDHQLQQFLERLEGPTVPTPLSRRILQRQGVAYLDPTVAEVTSAAADHFLAQVLQESLICREHRCKTTSSRKRHRQRYRADADDRRRRKAQAERHKEKEYLSKIEAAEKLGSKKKVELPSNGDSNGDPIDVDEQSYDSVDAEEEYYHNYYGSSGKDDDDEVDDRLILPDIVRPLQARGFSLMGKKGLEPPPDEDSDEESVADETKPEPPSTENGEAVDEDDDATEAASKAEPPSPDEKPSRATTPQPPNSKT